MEIPGRRGDSGLLGHAGSPPARGRLSLTEDHVRELRRLAELSYPFEACGLLVGTVEHPPDRRTVSLVLANNLSPMTERRSFVLDPQDYLDTVASAHLERLEVIGVWHTHPDHPAEPSALDLENAWAEHSQLIVSVDAMGDTVLRSWRLAEGRFVPEAIGIETRH